MSGRLFYYVGSGYWSLGKGSGNQLYDVWSDGSIVSRGGGVGIVNAGVVPNLNSVNLRIDRDIGGGGGANAYGVLMQAEVQSDATTSAAGFTTILSSEAGFGGILRHFYATIGTLNGAPSAQYGFHAASDNVGASGNNISFYSAIPTGSNHYSFYGLAKAYFDNQILQRCRVETPSSGSTVTLNDRDRNYYNNNTVAIASLTINMPPSPVDGQKHTIQTRGTITAITISGNGNSIRGPITTMGVQTSVEYTYMADAAAWTRSANSP